MSEGRKPAVILRAADIAAQPTVFSHPYNPRSELGGAPLSRLAGLARAPVSLGRIQPGKESFVLHAHHFEEEWLYILEGQATLISGEEEHIVGPGDFIAFGTPSLPHHLRNDSAGELVYLMGGENRDVDIIDFPQQGKIGVKSPEGFIVFDAANKKNWGEL
ncbi:cupin domain-containing protein [Microvirga brassicacearum]|uniref:Cupin domain-containing protein n=1 Tax=Microvirga brassicacearum TaxID=2580413 RepID=A0A5N3PHF2_9HYPH|nr:cupin domain-containing protein [Microvirga brassicacearum]KAB0269171.1 cupin domain-containing protein [Microvirga brassicacearum]